MWTGHKILRKERLLSLVVMSITSEWCKEVEKNGFTLLLFMLR